MARYMFVGEAPGKNEDEQGLPFVGKAGDILAEIIKLLGIAMRLVYITNVVKCRPPNNRDPIPYEIERCSSWLDKEIQQVKPDFIFCLGAIATSRISPASKRGDIIYHPMWKCYVFFLYHPAALAYEPNRKVEMNKHLKGYKEFIDEAHGGS